MQEFKVFNKHGCLVGWLTREELSLVADDDRVEVYDDKWVETLSGAECRRHYEIK